MEELSRDEIHQILGQAFMQVEYMRLGIEEVLRNTDIVDAVLSVELIEAQQRVSDLMEEISVVRLEERGITREQIEIISDVIRKMMDDGE